MLPSTYIHFKQYIWTCSVNTLKQLLHLCLHHQNHKDRVNNFPLFDDDKPNDHIDFFKNKDGCQPKYVHKNTQNKEKFLKKHNRNLVKSKRHGHPYLPPFGIIEKELVEQTS